MKGAGIVLIILSSLLLGFMQAQKLKKRKSALLDLQKLLLKFKAGIRYSAKPIEILITENQESEFCEKAVKNPGFSHNPCAALLRAGEELLNVDGDRTMFRDFISGLGASDTENQMDHIQLYEVLVSQQLGEASEDFLKRSKLFVALGLFGGITVSMLII